MPPVNIEEIALPIILPTSRVGIVLLQPHLTLSPAEPFKITAARRGEQLESVRRTLKISRDADHGAGKTHFTLLPEYSVPGVEGIALIQTELSLAAWPNDTVLMGGIDGLTKAELGTVLAEPNTTCAGIQDIAAVPDGQWINCFITWAKDSRGNLHRWIQPKIQPAWAEVAARCERMFQGNSVFLYRAQFANGAACRFLGLICYDWIGQIGGTKILDHVLGELHTRWQGSSNELHWLFVLKHNPKPNHREFLATTAAFFENLAQHGCVNRDYCAVVMANTAATPTPGRDLSGGCASISFSTSAPFSRDGCPATYSLASRQFRGIDTLDRLFDAVLRENGACIHSLSQEVPRFRNRGVGARAHPIDIALVHPIIIGSADPRLPAASVPAAVKWVNDALDRITPINEEHDTAPTAPSTALAHTSNTADVRLLRGTTQEMRVQLCTYDALTLAGQKFPFADWWGSREMACLNHMLDVLAILRTALEVDIASCATHGLVTLSGSPVEVLAISGASHKDCRLYAEKYLLGLTKALPLLRTALGLI